MLAKSAVQDRHILARSDHDLINAKQQIDAEKETASHNISKLENQLASREAELKLDKKIMAQSDNDLTKARQQILADNKSASADERQLQSKIAAENGELLKDSRQMQAEVSVPPLFINHQVKEDQRNSTETKNLEKQIVHEHSMLNTAYQKISELKQQTGSSDNTSWIVIGIVLIIALKKWRELQTATLTPRELKDPLLPDNSSKVPIDVNSKDAAQTVEDVLKDCCARVVTHVIHSDVEDDTQKSCAGDWEDIEQATNFESDSDESAVVVNSIMNSSTSSDTVM